MFGPIIEVKLIIKPTMSEQDVIRELNRHVFKDNIFKSSITVTPEFKHLCLKVRITEDIEEFEFVQGEKTLITPTNEYSAIIY
jgi:hypothetical protein